MSKQPLAEQFKRNTAITLIVCLFVLLWLPTVDSFFHLDHAPAPNENRAMAKFPVFKPTLDGVHDFPAGLEAYFRDHFGFRNRLIRWERKWKHDLFHDAASPDVLTGRDGWLYYSGQYMVGNFQGQRLWTQEELDNWQKLLEKRRDWLAQRGIKYIFAIPPDKHSVYPEYLPDWLAHLGGTNKVDQFFAYMKTRSTVPVLNLRPFLIEAKKNGWTYLRNDTHWNAYGGFVAYQSLIDSLTNQLPGLTPTLPLKAFQKKDIPLNGGDLARLLGQAPSAPELNAVALYPHPPLPLLTASNTTERLVKHWRPQTEPRVSHYEPATGKAIVFRDSFSGAWYQFLAYHFNEVIYIWQYEWDPDFIEREKPLVVIDEILERFFNDADPKKLMEKDSLR